MSSDNEKAMAAMAYAVRLGARKSWAEFGNDVIELRNVPAVATVALTLGGWELMGDRWRYRYEYEP